MHQIPLNRVVLMAQRGFHTNETSLPPSGRRPGSMLSARRPQFGISLELSQVKNPLSGKARTRR